jgi:hypothetical protein
MRTTLRVKEGQEFKIHGNDNRLLETSTSTDGEPGAYNVEVNRNDGQENQTQNLDIHVSAQVQQGKQLAFKRDTIEVWQFADEDDLKVEISKLEKTECVVNRTPKFGRNIVCNYVDCIAENDVYVNPQWYMLKFEFECQTESGRDPTADDMGGLLYSNLMRAGWARVSCSILIIILLKLIVGLTTVMVVAAGCLLTFVIVLFRNRINRVETKACAGPSIVALRREAIREWHESPLGSLARWKVENLGKRREFVRNAKIEDEERRRQYYLNTPEGMRHTLEEKERREQEAMAMKERQEQEAREMEVRLEREAREMDVRLEREARETEVRRRLEEVHRRQRENEQAEREAEAKQKQQMQAETRAQIWRSLWHDIAITNLRSQLELAHERAGVAESKCDYKEAGKMRGRAAQIESNLRERGY